MGFYKAHYRKIMALVAVIFLASGSLGYGEEGIVRNVDSARAVLSLIYRKTPWSSSTIFMERSMFHLHENQNLTVEAVEMNFAQELKEGKIRIEIRNVEEEQNSHFETDYQLSAQSVIISKVWKAVR